MFPARYEFPQKLMKLYNCIDKLSSSLILIYFECKFVYIIIKLCIINMITRQPKFWQCICSQHSTNFLINLILIHYQCKTIYIVIQFVKSLKKFYHYNEKEWDARIQFPFATPSSPSITQCNGLTFYKNNLDNYHFISQKKSMQTVKYSILKFNIYTLSFHLLH